MQFSDLFQTAVDFVSVGEGELRVFLPHHLPSYQPFVILLSSMLYCTL